MPIQKQRSHYGKFPTLQTADLPYELSEKHCYRYQEQNRFKTRGEPKILEFLAEHEPCEQKVIAAGCNLDSASVTGILGRMEKRELIKRETKNGNRRSLYVSRTEHGEQMTEVVEETFTFVDKRAVEGLTKAEVKELERLLERVSQNLVALSEEQKNEERTT